MVPGRSGKFMWVCMMGVMAFVTLGLGFIGVKDRVQSKPAQMVLDPSISGTRRKMLEAELEGKSSGVISAPVQYTFKDGKTLREGDARVETYELSSLLAGQTLSVYRHSGNPHAVYSKDELPNPTGWLIVGFVCAALAWYAIGLWKKESAQYDDDDGY